MQFQFDEENQSIEAGVKSTYQPLKMLNPAEKIRVYSQKIKI